MLVSSDDLTAGLAELRESDFCHEPHRLVFRTLLRLYGGEAKPVDAVALDTELIRSGDADGPGYAHQLASAASADFQADTTMLAKYATMRALSRAGHRITALTESFRLGERDFDATIDAAEAELYAAVGRVDGDVAHIPSLGHYLMEDALDAIEALDKRREGFCGVPTGFDDLDALTNGLQRGQVTIVAGRPAMGKSTLALGFARYCCFQQKLPAVFFTLDASARETTMRVLAAETRVALHHMRTGTMPDEAWNRLARKMAECNEAPLFIEDSPYLTLTQIRSVCRRLKQRTNLQMVVIDSVQLVNYGTRQFASRYEEISEISRRLKFLAKELDIAVVAVSELNRGPEARLDKRPMLQDLRDSGSLEDDADLVILLHREDAYARNSPRAGEADLIIAKHRHGPTATVTVGAQLHYSRFTNPSGSISRPEVSE